MDELRKITTELAKVEEGKVKAIAEGDRVYLMIQDAPSELRKLADTLEKIDVREIKALVAYAKPGSARKTSARTPKSIEATFPVGGAAEPMRAPQGSAVERIASVLERFRARFVRAGASLAFTSFVDGVVRLEMSPDAAPEAHRIAGEARAAIEREVPEARSVDIT